MSHQSDSGFPNRYRYGFLSILAHEEQPRFAAIVPAWPPSTHCPTIQLFTILRALILMVLISLMLFIDMVMIGCGL